MEIDWLTVIAQIVNFLVLVWLLQHFLYRPVINAMDKREQRIAARLEDAQQREQTAEQTVQLYENKRTTLEQATEQRLQKAEEAAQAKQLALLEKARDEVQQQREQWQQQLQQEQQEFLKGLRKTSVQAIQQTGRRVLADLADTELEMQMIAVFLQRLKNLDNELRQKLLDSDDVIHISSAFELDAAAKARITRAIQERLDSSAKVEYSRSTDLLCGIELTTGGHQISWNMEDHLQMLDEQLQKALNGGAETDA